MQQPVVMDERKRVDDEIVQKRVQGGNMTKVASPKIQLDYATNGARLNEEIGTLSPVNDPFRF